MVAYVYKPLPVFSSILKKAEEQNRILDNSKTSMQWLRREAGSVAKPPSQVIRSDSSRLVTPKELKVGQMYLYAYDPKHKDTLPYYDKFPLVMPFESMRTTGRAGTSVGFMGLNFHYLHPRLRARLLDGLLAYTNNDKMDETTRMQVSYKLLGKVSKLRYFRPCVKQYLFNHVRSRFMWIHPSEWSMSIFLPLDRFVKKQNQYVWKESKAII